MEGFNFELERDSVLEAIRDSLDKDSYVKLRSETPEDEKIKISFAVTVDAANQTVHASMSASLKIKQEGFADWSGTPLLDYIEQQERKENNE